MPNLSEYPIQHTLRVRWAEVDAQGIVFNGHYLTYVDIAITEYFRSLGITFPEGMLAYGSDLFVKKASIEYHASAHFDQWLQLYVRCGRVGNSSLQFLVEIFRDTTHLISGEVIYVNAEPTTKQPLRVSEALRQKIAGLENSAPQ